MAYFLYGDCLLDKEKTVGVKELFIVSTKSIVLFKEFNFLNVNGILNSKERRGKTILQVLTNQKLVKFYAKIFQRVMALIDSPQIPVHVDFEPTQFSALGNFNIKPVIFTFRKRNMGG